MPQFDLQALKTALAGDPRAASLDDLPETDLRHRLQPIANRTMRLTPASLTAHRVADLLVNVSNLRPGPRAVFLDHLFGWLDLSLQAMDVQSPVAPVEALASPPVPEPSKAATTGLEIDSPPASPPIAAAAAPVLFQFKRRPPDLFDRFLDCVAALMRLFA
jgi:hypothetical protein